jgi:FtsP/CotA-like multicopper oxidase with cupredoxin domain
VIKASCDAKWLALDIASSASIANFVFSIDEHPLWVYAVDGHYIEPLHVDALTVANGDRYSVFVRLDKPAATYGVRIASNALAQLVDTTALFVYDGVAENATSIKSQPFTNRAGLPVSPEVTMFNQSHMVSFPPQYPEASPEIDQTVIMELTPAGSSYEWILNGNQYSQSIDNLEPPILYQQPSESIIGENITIMTRNNTWVDLIFTVTLPGQPPHPIHKHSNKGFIIGQGHGNFTWSTVAEAAAEIPENFNLVTPPYRDGFVTPPSDLGPTWLAVRYHVVNPGAFIMHCHIQSHMSGGMAMVILDGVDEWPEVPEDCKN